MKKKFSSRFLALMALVFSQVAIAQTFSSVSTFAGTGTAGLLDGSTSTGRFNGPYDICCDRATGDIYVADALNHCIRKISNGIITTLAGNGSQGDVDAQGANARFYSPSGVCYDGGYVYITDNGNHKVKRIDSFGNVTTFAGTGTNGYVDGSSSQAMFSNPISIISDNNGTIYVCDYGNHCIRTISGGQVTTFAGTGGASGDQLGSAATAQFNRPTDICLDLQGNMYVTDQLNNKIKLISGGMVSLVAGSGTMASVDGTGASASFYKPCFLDFDLFYNSVFVSEGGTNKIRRLTVSGVTTTLAGTGSTGFTNGALNAATFFTPYGICLDSSGNLYIGDKDNNAIRLISLSDLSTPEYIDAAPLSFYPNPSFDWVTINNAEKLKSVSIYDMKGKLCKTITVNGEPMEITFSVADLAPGQYTVIADSETKKFAGKLIR